MAKTAKKEKLEVTLGPDKSGIYQLDFRDKTGHNTWEFSSNPLRAIIPQLAFTRTYQFISTVAHPAALDALAEENEKPELRREDKDFYFSDSLMDMYLAVTAKLMKKEGNEDISYKLVTYNHSGGHPHWEAPRWPVMHIIPADQADCFDAMVRNLHADAGYAAIKAHEAPQNYQMQQVDFLRQHKLEPLKTARHLMLGGETLRQVINLLCPFEYGTIARSNSDD